MPISSLREITIGVADLEARVRQFDAGCGLSVQAGGTLAPATMRRLFDNRDEVRVCLLRLSDAPDAPGIRLVELGPSSPLREGGLGAAGPLGLSFATPEVARLRSRLEGLGVDFVASPSRRPDSDGGNAAEGRSRPDSSEAFGRTADGDFLVLSEERDLAAGEAPRGGADSGRPNQVLLVVTNLEACLHFMSDVLGHETLPSEPGSIAPEPSSAGFRLAVSQRPGRTAGQVRFMEFEKRKEPMAQVPSLARGVCRLRYDTADLNATLARLPGGGGSLVRGPASIDDPVLGPGLVAMVRAPFGLLIELWQAEV